MLVDGGNIGRIVKGKEEDIVRKLVIIALWCIQLNPNDRQRSNHRPSITLPTTGLLINALSTTTCLNLTYLKKILFPIELFFSSCKHTSKRALWSLANSLQ